MSKNNSWDEVDKMMFKLETDSCKPIQPTQLAGFLFEVQKVSVALAKINDKSAKRIVHLTWALIILTIALLVLAIMQITSVHYVNKNYDQTVLTNSKPLIERKTR